MQHKKIPPKKIINALGISVMICLVILIAACSGNSESSDGTTATTTTEPPSTVAVPPTSQGNSADASKNFYHLKIDSAVLVDSFFKKSATFKKIIFNFKINDYANFPGTLTLVAHGAKQNDDFIDFNPEVLDVLTNNEAVSIDDLLYSTMEFSRRKIQNLIGNPLSADPAQRKSFTHLVFVPDIQTMNGQRHLYYRVQKRPIDPSAQEPTEDLNPCPPFKPNQN